MKALIKTGLLAALLGVVACGGGDDDDGVTPTPDSGVTFPDAGPDAMPVCPVTATITETPVEGQMTAVLRTDVTGGGTRLIWNFVVGGGTDFLQFGIDEPITLNTPLELVQACTQATNYCWVLLGDYTVTNNMIDSDVLLYPDTGTITITEAGPTGTGRFKATITSAMFNHYDANGPVNDGCTTTTPAYTVDLPITAPTKPVAEIKPVQLGHAIETIRR